jgi:5-bromo-4-chloroindolyl phosphate hydrolysis protein
MKQKPSAKTTILAVLAGIGAIAVLQYLVLLLAKFVSIPFVLPVIIGVVIFLVIRGSLGKKERARTIAFEGVTFGEIDAISKTGKKLTTEMRNAINRLGQTDIRAAVNDLCNIADSIFAMLHDDPRDLRIVKQFITYYLEPTHKIILKYAELATARPMPADAVATLQRTEQSLASIRRTFLEQKDKMLANDAMDLATEIKVFESTAGIQSDAGGKDGHQKHNRSYPGN